VIPVAAQLEYDHHGIESNLGNVGLLVFFPKTVIGDITMRNDDLTGFRKSITGFLADQCHVDVSGLGPDDPLFSSQLLSSIDLIDLVLFIEETLGTKIDPMDVKLEQMDTIDKIARFCLSKAG